MMNYGDSMMVRKYVMMVKERDAVMLVKDEEEMLSKVDGMVMKM